MKYFLALCLLAASGCHSVRKNGGSLRLSLDPPELAAGQLITVTAAPEPAAELAWVSGTVKVMGAATLPFRKDPSTGHWQFKTMIPAFVSLPSGSYEAKAWGETRAGARYEGSMTVLVK